MLRHSETRSGENASGASLRPSYRSSPTEMVKEGAFTAEEIASAIAAIESEKALRRSTQSRAAQIAAVLEHLDLDMSASEVEAKIEQQRLSRRQVGKGHRRSHLILAGVAATLSWIGIGIGGWFWGMRQTPVVQEASTTMAVAVPAQKAAIAPEGTTAVDVASAQQVAMAAAQDAAQREHLAKEAMRRAQIAVIEAREAQERAAKEVREQATRSR